MARAEARKGKTDWRAGRISKLTPEVFDRICDLVAEGVPEVVAAGTVGVRRATYYEWLNRGENNAVKGRPARTIHREFADAIARARATAEMYLSRSLLHAKSPVPAHNAQFILVRRFRRRWSERAQEHERMIVDTILGVVRSHVSGEALAAILADIDTALDRLDADDAGVGEAG